MTRGPSIASHNSIAIIGGGLIGLSCGWQLARGGWAVTVYDRSTLGGEASWAGAGMLALGGEFHTDSSVAQLAFASRRLYRSFVNQLENESGVFIDFQETGALELAYSDEQFQSLEARSASQEAIGIRSKRIVPAQVRAFWPHLRREGLVGARFYPDDAVVNPRDLINALKIACQKTGVTLIERCEVRSLSVRQESAQIETSDGLAAFDIALLAAGAWSSEIRVSGVPEVPTAKPIKGHLIGYHQPDQTCPNIIRHEKTYTLQRANGLLIVGASVEDVGFDRKVDEGIAKQLSKEAAFIFPHLGETTPTDIWVGFRPGAAELEIGPWHSPRLVLAYGHYRNGILLAPVTAEKVVDGVNANWQKR